MISEYINYLRNIKGHAQNTATGYEKDLRTFASYIRATDPTATWSTITRDHIDRYICYKTRQGLKPTTTNRHLAAISGLYNYMIRQGMNVQNPCKYESRRKVAERTPNTINNEDLQNAYKRSVGATRYLLGILITTGARIQEVLDIRWEDVDFKTGAIKIESGKGQKQRTVYTLKEVTNELYVIWRWSTKTGRIFTIDQRTARYMIYEALRTTSRAKQLSPHAIRHSVATNLAKQGTNTTTLQQILGHKDIRTTQKYIDLGQSRVQETLQTNSILY